MNRRRWLHLLNILIAIALASLVIWTSRPWEVWQLDTSFTVGLLASLLLDATLVVVWAFRHSYVLNAAGSPVAPLKLLSLVTFSNTANNLTPAATGEVARAWFLKRNHGVPTDKAGAAIVFERLYILGLMALTALLAGVVVAGVSVWIIVATATVLVVYALALPTIVAPFTARFASRELRGGRIRRTLVGAARGGLALWGDTRVAAGTALWSLAAFAIQGIVFWIAASNSGLELTALQAWALLGGGTVAGIISALPFGLGAAEITAAGIGTLLGLDPAYVASAFVLYRLFLTFPLALAGSVAYGRLSTRKLSESAE